MSQSFSIDKGVLGTENHFCFNGKNFVWVEEHPADVFVFRHHSKPTDLRCLNTLFKLNGIEVKHLMPETQVSAWKTILRNDFVYEEIRWQYVLQPPAFKSFLLGLAKNIQNNLGKVSTEYHERVFSRVSELFDSLDFASIDVAKLNRYKEAEQSFSNKSVLDSFRPVAGSMARKPVYDRFGSRTGRLTVESGPQILTLKRTYRDLIVSTYPGGKIFYVDFSALEARTFLTIAGREVLTKDVYEEIAENFLKGKYSRSVVKLCVLALLFGSSIEPIQKLLKASKQETHDFVDKLKKYFCLDELRTRLYKEWAENGKKIRNFYGRVIDVPDENTLVNSYIQSTGVDVALLGFLNIVQSIRKKELKISPLFVLHDALLLDVHPQHFDQLTTIIRPGFAIPGMKNQFFLHVDPLEVEQPELNEVPSTEES